MVNTPIPDAQQAGGPAGQGMPQQGGQGFGPGGGNGPALGQGVPQMQPTPQPQLPAQMFTTAAQLLDLTDKKLMVVLRDGRKITGVLRSWDQFANIVLQSSVERIFITPEFAVKAGAVSAGNGEPRGIFADFPRGTFLVRGENVLLLGEIDLDKDDDPPPGYDQADPELVKKLDKQLVQETKSKEKKKVKALAKEGFEGENIGEKLL